MNQYILKRILTAIPTLIAISLVIFLILALAPGDPMGEFATNPSITAEVRENIRRSLGLDQPIPIRYIKWFWAFLQGDMGYSFTSRSSVSETDCSALTHNLMDCWNCLYYCVVNCLSSRILSALKTLFYFRSSCYHIPHS
jgi:peptide/nickel transport system permease protein